MAQVGKNLFRALVAKTSRLFMPSDWNNFEYNKAAWHRYAKYWNRTLVNIMHPHTKGWRLNYLGEEWGTPADVERIVGEYIHPFITRGSIVGEIGSGGARIASKVAGRTKEFYCFDISRGMLKRAESVLRGLSNVKYVLLERPQLPSEMSDKFDFIYAFDVFVHLDTHTMWKYFKEIRRILKRGGNAFIHTTNLRAPAGWQRFSSQETYSVAGHFFVSPEIVDILAEQSNLKIIKTSAVDPSNFYLNRDYLVVLLKP